MPLFVFFGEGCGDMIVDKIVINKSEQPRPRWCDLRELNSALPRVSCHTSTRDATGDLARAVGTVFRLVGTPCLCRLVTLGAVEPVTVGCSLLLITILSTKHLEIFAELIK